MRLHSKPPITVRPGVYDDATTRQLEAWLNGGPEGIRAFKAWAVRQPIRWTGGLPSKEAAEANLDKLAKGWAKVRREFGALYVLENAQGTWDVWESPVTLARPQLTTGQQMDEFEPVTGYIYTHIDCPNCDDNFEVHGDATGDTLECPACHVKFKIGRVI